MEDTEQLGSAPPPAGAARALAAAPHLRLWAARATDEDWLLALTLGVQALQTVGALRPPASAPWEGRGPAPAPPGSAARGAQGEEAVYALLARERRVRDVARRAHSADLALDTPAGPVHIEVKHYSGAVPAREVEKFLGDLRARDAAAGVLVSLTSPIAGQRAALTVTLEPRVAGGVLVPVVYAAAARAAGARLADEVVVAAVDLAALLAEVYPRGLQGLHGRSSALAWSVAADQLADGAHCARTDLARLAGGFAGEAAQLGEALSALGRQARELARSQRAEVEEAREVALDDAAALAADLGARYPVCAPEGALAAVIRAVQAAAGAGERGHWQLLKARAVHRSTGCALSFLKGATAVRVPLERLAPAAVAAAVAAHPKKVGVADGALALDLDEGTLPRALALIGAPAPGAGGR